MDWIALTFGVGVRHWTGRISLLGPYVAPGRRPVGKQFAVSRPVGKDVFLAAAPAARPKGACYFADWAGAELQAGPLNRQSVRSCLARIPKTPFPVLFGLFVDDETNLLALDVLGQGNVNQIHPSLSQLMRRAEATGATGIILAIPASCDDTVIDQQTLERVARLRRNLDACDLPLLDYLVVGPTRTFGIGSW